MALEKNIIGFFPILYYYIFILWSLPGSDAATFTLANNCNDTVRTAILGKPQLSTTAFSLKPGEPQPLIIASNTSCSARIWGTTVCSSSTAVESCTRSVLVEVTLNANGRLDSYSIHLVHGFNLPIAVVPQPGGISGNRPNCSSSFRTSCEPAKYLITFCPDDSSHVNKKRHSKLGENKKALAQLLKLIGIAMWVLTTIWSLWRAGCSLKDSNQLAEAASTGITIAQQLNDPVGDDNA